MRSIHNGINRRDFLRQSALAGAGLADQLVALRQTTLQFPLVLVDIQPRSLVAVHRQLAPVAHRKVDSRKALAG